MTFLTILFCLYIVAVLWRCLTRLTDIRDTLKDIQYRNFNIECEDPSKHFVFTQGADDDAK